MAVFSIAAMSATGVGPVFAGWIAMNTHLEWRWIQWIHMMCVFQLPYFITRFLILCYRRTVLQV